jgi:hypothetical protein
MVEPGITADVKRKNATKNFAVSISYAYFVLQSAFYEQSKSTTGVITGDQGY